MIEEQGDAVRVAFLASQLSPAFRSFVADEGSHGRALSVDHLIVLHHLLWHVDIDTAAAARICQRMELEARDTLSQMEREFGYLERGGTTRGTYWSLRPELHHRLAGPGHPERDQRIDWEAAKTRVLSVLKQRDARNEQGLTNKEIRQITYFNRHQAVRLMHELIAENPQIQPPSRGRGAFYKYQASINARKNAQ